MSSISEELSESLRALFGEDFQNYYEAIDALSNSEFVESIIVISHKGGASVSVSYTTAENKVFSDLNLKNCLENSLKEIINKVREIKFKKYIEKRTTI